MYAHAAARMSMMDLPNHVKRLNNGLQLHLGPDQTDISTITEQMVHVLPEENEYLLKQKSCLSLLCQVIRRRRPFYSGPYHNHVINRHFIGKFYFQIDYDTKNNNMKVAMTYNKYTGLECKYLIT